MKKPFYAKLARRLQQHKRARHVCLDRGRRFVNAIAIESDYSETARLLATIYLGWGADPRVQSGV